MKLKYLVAFSWTSQVNLQSQLEMQKGSDQAHIPQVRDWSAYFWLYSLLACSDPLNDHFLIIHYIQRHSTVVCCLGLQYKCILCQECIPRIDGIEDKKTSSCQLKAVLLHSNGVNTVGLAHVYRNSQFLI